MLHGLVPDKDIEIKFTGLKPGEKMYEELFREGDIRKDTGHSDIFAAVSEEAESSLSEEQLQGLKGNEAKPRGNEAEPRKTMGDEPRKTKGEEPRKMKGELEGEGA